MISRQMQQRGLQVVDNQVDKVIQLLHTLRATVGVIVVGNAGGGKSTLLTTLAELLGTKEGNEHADLVRFI
jgi:ABC-type cobalamin/Fe3+-siderophores transport system ATPase subunit